MQNRKLKMGMIGGGPGSFIGPVHLMAASLDGEIELVGGAFSSDAERSNEMGRQLQLDRDRVYSSFREMFKKEANLPSDERMDIVSIVTPNHLHFEPAKLALESGFHLFLEKPMCFDLAEAKQLREIATRSKKYFCLAHTYTGYPMIKEARQQVIKGALGVIRKIFVSYTQGWLSNKMEAGGNKQAQWRTDPSKSGMAGAMGDIGTHAFHLAEYISGLQVTSVCADINTIVKGRALDDDGTVLLKFNNGASGILVATQVAAGEENELCIKVYGEKGGLEWSHRDPGSLLMKWLDRPTEIMRAGSAWLSSFARHNTRLPAGHPEGYIEAFANHYRNFALCIKAERNGEEPKDECLDFPGIEEGVRGMLFVEKIIESGKNTVKWMEL